MRPRAPRSVGDARSVSERRRADSAGGAWNEWIGTGRLSLARAQIAIEAEGPEAAVEQALTALELARRGRRLKYQARAAGVVRAFEAMLTAEHAQMLRSAPLVKEIPSTV